MVINEFEIISKCASRFDGHAYGAATPFDASRALAHFFETGAWNIAPIDQPATLAYLQRVFHWSMGFEPDGGHWRAFRELFLMTCKYEIPDEYKRVEACDEWDEKFVPHLAAYEKYVEVKHRKTQYDDRVSAGLLSED